ncbi:DUF6293 family protein [Haloarcula litorea]|uniref:HFX_2341 family transcriptional regulator domain-containing protein n=1 Tax=Haloarcula litorea TaxID=3032579 RepID=UPI0023E87BEE|nr:DUF6293 family protein [Halomicroarcula sp. GDY20]
MSETVHLIPVGIDVERLFLPITQGDLAADGVVLYRARRHSDDRAVADLAERMFHRLEYTFETVLGAEVETAFIESVHDYENAYKTAYRAVRKHVDDAEVWINISSMPRTVSFAFATAANTIVNERPELRDRVHVYYVPPEAYLTTNMLRELEAELEFLRGEGGDPAERADEIEALLETVRERGITAGAREIDGQRYVELPAAPLAELRPFERELLAVLGEAGATESTSALARELARARGDDPDESLRSKVQYNVERLEAKGFLRREDSGGQYETRLTKLGRLWVETH